MSSWPRTNISIMAVIVPFVLLLLVLIAVESGRAI